MEVLLVLLVPSVKTAETMLPPPPPVHWQLTWQDDFNGNVLNSSTWNVRNNESHCCSPGKLPQELELYVDSAVTVANGVLELRTRRKTIRGPNGKEYTYSSGWIDSQHKWSQHLGKFEANCSLPSTKAEGVWPAFWLLPENGTCWPTGGEVDIFEMNGNPLQDAVYGSYHWGEPGERNCGKDLEPVPGASYRPKHATANWQEQWHVYGVEWRDDRLDFYVDGNLYLTRDGSKVNLPTHPMYVILNQAVDGWLFPPEHNGTSYGPNGVALRVEWVRAFSASS